MADHYVMGRLSAEERASFEEHLIGCQDCLDRVEMSARFRRGLRAAVAEDAEASSFLVRTGLLARLSHLKRWQQRTLLASVMLLFVAPATVIYFAAMGRTQQKLRQLAASYAGLQHEYAQQQQAESTMKEQLQVSEAARSQVQAQLDRERRSHANSPVGSSASLPLFALSMVRGADTDHPTPGKTVSVSRSASGVILLLELEPDTAAGSYRANLVNDGRIVWTASNLKLSGKDTIALILNSQLLTPGRYVLEVESCTQQRRCYPAASYSFQASTAD